MLRKWRKHPANTCIVKAFRKVNEDPILHCTCHYFDLNQKHGFNGYGTNQTKSEVVKWNSFVKFISHQQFWEYLKEKIVYETNFCEIKSTRKKKNVFQNQQNIFRFSRKLTIIMSKIFYRISNNISRYNRKKNVNLF